MVQFVRELPVLDEAATARPLSPSEAAKVAQDKKPPWLKIRPPAGESYLRIRTMLRERGLATVCEQARCPNLSECWASGTATFMIGGEICTRACRFCAVKTARRPPPLDPAEPEHVAETVAALKLRYVVLTMVDRDDLADGGASHFVDTVRAIKRRDPAILVEALVSDFRGDVAAVRAVVDSGLDVYAHNIETVRRLQYRVRDPRATYQQSIGTLVEAKRYARERGVTLHTKSAVMLGLGESEAELDETFADLRSLPEPVDVLTVGQYLRPSPQHLPVEKFYTPEEFEAIGERARARGFLYVAAGPLVRSSYKAAELFLEGRIREGRATSHFSTEQRG